MSADQARSLLSSHRAALSALVQALLTHGMLAPEDVRSLLRPHHITVGHAGEAAHDALVLEPYARKLVEFGSDAGIHPLHESECLRCL